MGKKSSPQAPTPVDPVALANAQSAANTATAREQQRLNMINTSGPNGAVNYTASDAPGGYTQTTTLSPAQQGIYDASTAAQQGALNLANAHLPRLQQALSTNVAAPTYQTSFEGGGPIATNVANAGQIQGSVPIGGGLQSSYDNGGDITRSYASGGNIQNSYDAGGNIQRSIGPTDFTADREAVTDAVWQQALSRLTPQYGQMANRLDTKLANQGVGANSAAYGNAQDAFGRQTNDALNQAAYSAIRAGSDQQQRFFDQSLNQGTFANNAQQQANQQNLQALQANNAAQQQGNQQNYQAAQFGNAAQQQANTQNASAAGFYNNAQLADFQRNLAAGNFANNAQQQGYGQNLTNAQFQNNAQNQQFNQNAAQAQFGNQARGQQFEADNYAQNQPINQFNALMNSGQVQMPNGVQYTPSQVANTDVLGAYGLNAAQQQNAYNAQLQNQSAAMNGLFSLGSAAILASDRRLKTDIEQIGALANGLRVYAYRYLWSTIRHVGVMAQEVLWVKPEAVVRMDNGYLAVDYGKLD